MGTTIEVHTATNGIGGLNAHDVVEVYISASVSDFQQVEGIVSYLIKLLKKC